MAAKTNARNPKTPKTQPPKVEKKSAAQKVLEKKSKVKEKEELGKSSIVTAEALQEELRGIDAEEYESIQSVRRVYSTGMLSLDAGLCKKDPLKGNGGIQELSIVEAYGPTGSGKSLLSLHLARNILDDDPENLVVFLLTEEPDMGIMNAVIGSHNKKRCIVLGAYNPKKPELKLQLAEERLMDLIKAAKYQNVKLLVIDSVKALISADQVFEKGDVAKQKDKPISDDEMAIRARIMEKMFNRLIPNRKCAILWMVNHISTKIPTRNDRFILGQDLRDNTPGGALKSYMSLIRLHVDSESIKDESGTHTVNQTKPIIGKRIVVKIKKNRHGWDGRKVSADYYYDYGFDNAKEVFHWGRYVGAFERSGNYYQFKEERVNGEKAAILYLREHESEIREIGNFLVDNHIPMFKLQTSQKAATEKAKSQVESIYEDSDEDE